MITVLLMKARQRFHVATMVKSSFGAFFAQKGEFNKTVLQFMSCLYCLIFLMERNALNLIMVNYQRTCTGSSPIVIVTVAFYLLMLLLLLIFHCWKDGNFFITIYIKLSIMASLKVLL